MKSAFILKVFNHRLDNNVAEEEEVRDIRLQNIENENQVMVRTCVISHKFDVFKSIVVLLGVNRICLPKLIRLNRLRLPRKRG